MTVQLRRGLPRVRGGEPWPPVGTVAVADAGVAEPAGSSASAVTEAVAPATSEAAVTAPAAAASGATVEVAIRSGLPRVGGGEPWPGSGSARVAVTLAGAAAGEAAASESAPAASAPEAAESPAASASVAAVASAPEARPSRLAPLLRSRVVRWSGAALVTLVVAVLAARWLLTLDPVQDFVAAYPGTPPRPADAPVGIPAWLAWQHFFNVFLMVMIVRTGLQVRTQKRPEAYFAPRTGAKPRISLIAWTHQALDVAWVVNGVVYVVLLLTTGQWLRMVPTDWSVIPHAASSVLQYLALDWPADDSWIYYNALQQLLYTTVVFIAAPLAILSGVRMSLLWPEKESWARAYPIELARRIHFPVMLFFVAFVVGHVGLVLATGAVKNLSHMYAASAESTWVGPVLFLASLVVTAGAVAAIRPVLVAPLASRFGTVSGQ